MKKLYIDFDGVILDTIPLIYQKIEQAELDVTNEREMISFYETLDWKPIIKNAEQIHDSISCIRKIIHSNLFDVSILTHVNSVKEVKAKVRFLNRVLPGITIISVPKPLHKTDMVNPKGAILIDDFTGNLIDWEKKGGISIKFSLTPKDRGFPVIQRLDSILDEIYLNA
ncbi:MAG: hypothetical protein KH135_06870 [Firmicutes bacterium]|nr:hypothetical protein [Bacillota bacterium]